ncbi:MAG: penicillin-binding protein 2 [Rickettsiaceae bacterium]|nr:penicillin-binding protein 2 [Rickettsiaceae bacterium]
MLDKSTANKQIMTRRTFVIQAGSLGLLFVLASRMFYMQFIKKDDYKTLSDKNSIKMILIPPKRGEIFDVNNKIIAKNNSCFKLFLDKNGNPNFSLEIDLIIKILELDSDQIKEVQKRVRNGGVRVPAIIADYLDWKQISIIEERRSELKSVFIDAGFTRYYPMDTSMSHLLGYMGRSREEANSPNTIDMNFKVGKTGIERYYETELKGEFNYKRIEVNAYGKYVRELAPSINTPGKNLYINIDSDLQKQTSSYLAPNGCSSIVMDCTNGNLLICNSMPTFDPNQFVHLSAKYWNSLINNPYKPLIDKTIKSLYPPGSIFKIITALAALEEGIKPETKILCTGKAVLGGNKFRCAKRSGHGYLNMVDAIKYSCNTYIYSIAQQIGPYKIIEVAKKFGLGKLTNIDLPGELAGFVPSPEWKKKKHNSKWQLGDTLNLSIGQGFLLTTPIQLTRMIAAIASDGKLFTPQIAQLPPSYTRIDIQQKNIDIIKTALYHAINSSGGTGYRSRINYNSIKMSGKTGTSQVRGKKNTDDNLNSLNISWLNRNHAIFSGYAPSDKPKFAITVYYDHGGGGGTSAAPIAKKIMTDVLKKYL